MSVSLGWAASQTGPVAEIADSVYSSDMKPSSPSSKDDPQPVDPPCYDAELVEPPKPLTVSWAKPIPSAPNPTPHKRPRRKRLPLILFLVTCFSTFWAGVAAWAPMHYFLQAVQSQDAMPIRRVIVAHWQDGLIYMGCLLGILLMHEMGHFLAAMRYRIPASLPYFLPLPISPIGTMGAVIGMAGMRANRKEIFDIGIAGPLAGLVVAVPVMWIGIQRLDLTEPAHGLFALDMPLLVRWALDHASPQGGHLGDGVWHSQLNPYFMAGWVGLLVTGLNMLPVSQLDGGHVVYTLFGKRAHWIARGFMIVAIGYIVFTGAWAWSLMVLLVLLIGTDHPPTRDDSVRLGWFRTALGLASLTIPLLCFPPNPFKLLN